MTEQEIEKLREKLGGEYSVKRLNGAITVELVDIWDGVDFYENHFGIVKPLSESFRRKIKSGVKFLINPSTESAYVEQLKAKAHELYGEIKDGDRFEFTWIGDGVERSIHLKGKYDFYYDKESDTLDLHGFPLYNQGKWAKKVERIKVEGTWNEYNDDHLTVRFKFEYKGSHPNPVELSAHLAKCLEDYLNKSQ